MAVRKLVAISYCFAFLAVYLSSIAYAFLSESINKVSEVQLPQTTAMNATISAMASFSDWKGTLITTGIITLILAIICFIVSSRAMSSAI